MTDYEQSMVKAVLHLFKAQRDNIEDPHEKKLFDKTITLLDELKDDPSKERIDKIMEEHKVALEEFERDKRGQP